MRYIILILVLQSCVNHNSAITDRFDQLQLNALKFYNNRQYSQALPYLDTLIALDSTFGEAYFKRANCYANLMQKEKSIENNLKAIQYKYRIDDVFFNLGIDYLFVNDSISIEYFKKCLEENPKHPKAGILIAQLKKKE
jgi:tetratricopeptide (TPR) repeat protein